MIAVITADIINSTQNPQWKEQLLPTLELFGKTQQDWNLYRGDSIQIRIDEVAHVLESALILKSSILQIKDLDIRIAIGIGNETEKTKVVTQNSGSAYVNSGRLLEELSQNLEIQTNFSEQINKGINAGFALINTLCEQWTTTMAAYVYAKLVYPDKNQEQLAELLQTKQSNVSRTLSRAHWNVIEQYNIYFKEFVNSNI